MPKDRSSCLGSRMIIQQRIVDLIELVYSGVELMLPRIQMQDYSQLMLIQSENQRSKLMKEDH